MPETNDGWITPTNNSYNLRPRPTERNKKYIMTQDGQQSISER